MKTDHGTYWMGCLLNFTSKLHAAAKGVGSGKGKGKGKGAPPQSQFEAPIHFGGKVTHKNNPYAQSPPASPPMSPAAWGADSGKGKSGKSDSKGGKSNHLKGRKANFDFTIFDRESKTTLWPVMNG